MTHRFESAAFIPASPDAIFRYVDDHERLSSHMTRSSWMMGGGRMNVELDAEHGRRPGSRIRMSGRAFGLDLSLEEVVSEYDPPRRKTWETVGEPRFRIPHPQPQPKRRFDLHVTGMGLSYISMLTAFYVDNGKTLPLWQELPAIVLWLAPAVVGIPIIVRALLSLASTCPRWLRQVPRLQWHRRWSGCSA